MGRVAGPWGVRGWLRIEPWSEDPATLLDYSMWWLRAPGVEGAWREVEVVSARSLARGLQVELRGVTSREAAQALRGYEVGLLRDALVALAPDEHYWSDLEGMSVVNRSGVVLGRVTGVTANGAHAIVRVVDDQGAERLIPFVERYVDRVDAQGRRIDVDWLPDY